MDEVIARLLAEVACGPPASTKQVEGAQLGLAIQLPKDLIEFYESYGAADGDLTTDAGDDSGGWLILYPVDELISTNAAYEHRDKDLVVVGTDGGGEAYALNFKDDPPSWVVVPFIDLDAAHALLAGGSLADFVFAIRSNSYWDR